MAEYIEREAVLDYIDHMPSELTSDGRRMIRRIRLTEYISDSIPAADVVPVADIEKIIESLQEQADIYNARAKDLLVVEDGQVSQYTWAVSLRETYRRIIKTLDDLIS